MARDFADKSAARQWVWDRLSAEGVARFPFPPHGRIPNFAGAEVAAARLLNIEPWKSATAIKVNPDSPQRRCEPKRCAAASPFLYRLPDCASGAEARWAPTTQRWR
jgi:5-formyltetrahydrofolate cyclo-ligase